MSNIKIVMSEEQQEWLLKRLKIDWDEEVNYQMSNGDSDTEYLEKLKECYVAILSEPRNGIQALAYKQIIENMDKDIEEVKNNARIQNS